jgi:HK97 gp10 family phage protein
MALLGRWVVLFNRIPSLIAAVEANASGAAYREARKIAERARDMAPVDTGELRGSIHARPTGHKSAEVVAEARYAAYVEFGTYKMSAQPFFMPALGDAAEDLAEELGRPLGGKF